MNLKIEVLGSKAQFVQLDSNLLVEEAIDAIIKKLKLKEQNQQLGLYINGIELKRNTRVIQKNMFANDILQLRKVEQVKQVQGIKLRFNNQTKIAYVYLDDLNIVLYDQVEKQFSLSKDSFNLTFNDQILKKQIPLKLNQIDATSIVEVKTYNQFLQSKQMIELKLKYQMECKNFSFDLYGKVFQLEESAKALFQIKQDICIQYDKQILLPDQSLVEVDINKNNCLLILPKDSYQQSLSYVNIEIEYNGQLFPLQVSTDTLINELINLLKNQLDLTNIDIMKGYQVLPIDQTISQLYIKENSRLNVIPKQNNTLKLEIQIRNNIEKMEVENETVIQELIEQIESNFQLQNIELKLSNGQKLLLKNQTLKQYNIQNGTLLLVESTQQQQIRQSNGNDFYNNNNTIKVSVLYQQQRFEYQFLNNQLIQDLEKKMREKLNCPNKIQLVDQNKVLNLQNTFLQEGITSGCVLQCNILIDKIRIIEQPIMQKLFLKLIILFQNQQKEQMLDENTQLQAVIQSIKQQFSIDYEIYLKTKDRNLDSSKTLKENQIKDNTQIFVQKAIFKLTIIFKGEMQTLEATYDTLGEELQQQIKNQYQIVDDFDLLINGKKINPKQYLKDQGVKNQQILDVQIKKGQGIKILEQKNLDNPKNQQMQQQSQSQTDQKFQKVQYQQSQDGKINKTNSQDKPKISSKIIVREIVDMDQNSNFKSEQVFIKLKSNNLKESFEQIIEMQYETTISEIREYLIGNYQINNEIKLIFKGKELENNQNLANIQIKDHETIFVEPNSYH
ncbi:unnamed protein product (macronuclear) [Paramecium tetraurelia]|uniref:Ubiquitin-like domain-containing protein n=1 Tax=Paramecium tetraurelia TaxID=5888 RepID=A0E9Z7_PARTE|nr:uncharacterized protein GSPATT00024845001 [Paramecium tetraurelia]CAK92114.1 unnamed protein product [Paramecium tetraurelia]|eukprot:XP_001459511.1 hypothetical protein (macronuclear) [Paramecium tetraurelia strain d4-2]